MKIVFVGVGAVGGYFGGRMLEQGLDVVFLARPPTARILKNEGLHISSILGDCSIARPNICDDPAKAAPADVLLLAVKAYQVTAAASFAAPAVGENTTVIPLQNGVDAPRAAAEAIDEKLILGGLSKIFSEKTAPGKISHSDMWPSIVFGELRGGTSERVERIAAHLEPLTAMDVQVSTDIVTAMWKKLLLVAALGAVGAVTRVPVGVVRSIPTSRMLLQAVIDEIAAVGRANGADLPPAFCSGAIAAYDKLLPETTASMHRDLVRGLPSELEEQIGSVIRYGDSSGVPTPTLDTLYAALLPGEMRARGAIDFSF